MYRGFCRLHSSIDLFINAALATNPILTLYDLEQKLLFKLRDLQDTGATTFADLQLGPLSLHPDIRGAFKLRTTSEVRLHHALLLLRLPQ